MWPFKQPVSHVDADDFMGFGRELELRGRQEITRRHVATAVEAAEARDRIQQSFVNTLLIMNTLSLAYDQGLLQARDDPFKGQLLGRPIMAHANICDNIQNGFSRGGC